MTPFRTNNNLVCFGKNQSISCSYQTLFSVEIRSLPVECLEASQQSLDTCLPG